MLRDKVAFISWFPGDVGCSNEFKENVAFKSLLALAAKKSEKKVLQLLLKTKNRSQNKEAKGFLPKADLKKKGHYSYKLQIH